MHVRCQPLGLHVALPCRGGSQRVRDGSQSHRGWNRLLARQNARHINVHARYNEGGDYSRVPGRRQKQRSVDGGSDGECWDSDDGNVEGYVYMAENNNSHPHLLSQDDETMPEVSAAEELRKRRNAALFRGVVRGWTEDRPPITTHELDMAERMDACDVNGERRLSSFCLNSPEPRLGVYSDEPHPKSHLQTTVDDTEHGKVRAGGKLGWAGRLAPGSSSDDSGSSSGSDRSQEQASPAMSSGSGLAGARSSSGGRKKEREDDNLYEYKQGSRGSMSSELPDGGPEWLSALHRPGVMFRELVDKVLYVYFNWRKGTVNDLTMVVAVNCVLVSIGAAMKMSVLPFLGAGVPADSQVVEQGTSFLDQVYEVLLLTIFTEPPEQAATWLDKVFTVGVAVMGVASFAIILALIEQAVLESWERNVAKGGPVFEQGHTVVLGWLQSQLDISVLFKLLQELCLAHRVEGGRAFVILCSRPKMEMEELFRSILPEEARYGSTFIFRQGNPLIPDDLRLVKAQEAKSIVIIADQTRPPHESDAMVLRTAVLLDELEATPNTTDRAGCSVICEVQCQATRSLMRYACSSRFLPFPTVKLNARRVARMVHHPMVSAVSKRILSFASQSKASLDYYPQLVGTKWNDVLLSFPEAIVLGYFNEHTGESRLNPPDTYTVRHGDHMFMIRPTETPKGGGQPVAPARVSISKTWKQPSAERIAAARGDPEAVAAMNGANACVAERNMRNRDILAETMRGTCQTARTSDYLSGSSSGLFMYPSEQGLLHGGKPVNILVCGWGKHTFMNDFIAELDDGYAKLPPGSKLVFVNEHTDAQTLAQTHQVYKVKNIKLEHVQGNPSQAAHMSQIDITQFASAVIFCDYAWMDPDMDLTNGQDMDVSSMLRLDSLMLLVQLNIRRLLEEASRPDINIITEKVAYQGLTRFEDPRRLPMGITFNTNAYAAKLVAQAAVDAKLMEPVWEIGREQEVQVIDSSLLCDLGEEISFWELFLRARSVGQTLMGYIDVPPEPDEPINLTINPRGADKRMARRVWNNGDGLTSLVVFWRKKEVSKRTMLTRPEQQDMAPVGARSSGVLN